MSDAEKMSLDLDALLVACSKRPSASDYTLVYAVPMLVARVRELETLLAYIETDDWNLITRKLLARAEKAERKLSEAHRIIVSQSE